MDDAGDDVGLYYDHEWQVHGNDVLNSSIGMILAGHSCSSSAPLANSFCPPMWDDQNADGLSSGYVESGVDWTPNSMFRGGIAPFDPHVVADKGFIERAATFGGSSFGDLDPLSCRGFGATQDAALAERGESSMRCNEEAKNGVGLSSNESNSERENRVVGVGCKKRKRDGKGIEQHHENDEAEREKDTKQKGGEYMHVRARRGQATNSHSLAERVRREKISERMKFLQDLVPGCSKVTGKAVMLDEIINYVQSLQRQVEFLSMKLATINPRLDLKLLSEHVRTPHITMPFPSPELIPSLSETLRGQISKSQGGRAPQHCPHGHKSSY